MLQKNFNSEDNSTRYEITDIFSSNKKRTITNKIRTKNNKENAIGQAKHDTKFMVYKFRSMKTSISCWRLI